MLKNIIANRPIRTSLIIGFIVFITLPAMVVAIFSFIQSQKVLEKSVFNTLDYLVDAQENAIYNWANGRKDFVRGLTQNADIKSMEPDKAEVVLANALKMDSNFRSLILAGVDGKSKVDPAYKTNTINMDVSDREYFKQAMAGKTFISDVLKSRYNNEPIITVASPVKRQEEVVGVLFGAVNIKVITKLVQQNFPGDNGESYLINDKGFMISESKFTDELLKRKGISSPTSLNLKLSSLPASNIVQGKSGKAIYINYLGDRVFGVYHWLPDLRIGLIVEKEYYTAMLEAGIITYLNLAIVSGIIIILFTIFAVVYSRRLAKPLEQLAAEVNNIAEGDFKSDISIRANKEVEELAKAINYMSSNLFYRTKQLNNLIQQLEQSQDDLEKEKKKLTKISTTDELTGLYNRRYLNYEFDRLINLCATLGKNISFMMLDLDRFKKVNDTYGHAIGDIVLREFAQILKNCSRATDVVGRFGGEEFIIIVPFVKGDLVKDIAERIRHEVSNFIFDKEEHKIHITVSIGIATIGLAPGESAKEVTEKMLKAADECLYNAKNTGRNRVVHQTICEDCEDNEIAG